jgi:hypothetical protein
MKYWMFGLAALAMGSAAGAQVIDGTHDWLPTYTGAQNGDLDIASADAWFDGSSFALRSTQNGAVGSSVGSLYVWGINRGAGTARLGVLGAPPAIGPDKLFDALAVLFPNGTARVVTFPAAGAPTVTVLGSAAKVHGDTISALIPLSLLPSRGFATDDYVFTLWSRLRVNPAADGNNHEVADFAPDAGGFRATVPEPASWAMLVLGFGGIGGAMRSRRVRLRYA